MVATAQRFHELHPGVEIVWEKRSLQEFADKPLTELVQMFDLLVIDNPWSGFVAHAGILLDLRAELPAEFLEDQSANSVGRSFSSYEFGGGQWALAIDAAAPVSVYRQDLLEKAGVECPATWEELIALGRQGLVCCPSIPLDVYGNFLNLCVSAGDSIFQDCAAVTTTHAGRSALERLRELASVVPAECFDMNPIAVCEMMSHADKFAYCPFTYGYSNYSRPGYAPRLLEFGSVISVAGKRPASTMLGGTGLAVSTYCKHRGPALEYTMFVASSSTQRGIYFDSGGQPAHRFAWLDDRVNEHCNNYFRDTLSTLDAAFVRPRYDGYLAFQDQAGYPIHKYLRERGDAGDVLDGLNRLYYESHGKK